MKKSLHKLVLAAFALLGFAAAPDVVAETVEVSNYVENFETFVGGADTAPKYWGHYKPGTGVSDYTKSETGGHDGGAYVAISSDLNKNSLMTYNNNCLYTPPVQGTVTFWVKGASTSSKYIIYTMTSDASGIKRGSAFNSMTAKALTTTWEQVTLNNVPKGTRLGILVSKGGGIDDFKADYAQIEKEEEGGEKSIAMSGFEYPKEVQADKDGKVTVDVTFTVTSGTADIEADSYKFTAGVVGIMATSLQTKFTTRATTPAIAKNSTAKITMSFDYTLADPSETTTLGVSVLSELKDGDKTKTELKRIGSIKVISPAGALDVTHKNTTLSNGGKIELGLLRANPSYNTLSLKNSGNSPIIINDVKCEGDMEGAEHPTLPLTIEAGADPADFAIAIPKTGAVNGAVTLVYSDGFNDAKEFSYNVSGAVLPEDAWIEDFQYSTAPELPKGWITGEEEYYTVKESTNVYAIATNGKVSSLVTPKMHLEDGGAITLQGKRNGTFVSPKKNKTFLTVYYSADRENWTELGNIYETAPEGGLPANSYLASTLASEWNWYDFSLKDVETGDYYVKFEAAPYCIDNIFGIAPADIDHDLMPGDLTAESEGEVNAPFTAEFTVNNLNGKADGDFTITLYEDGEAVAEIEGEEIEAYGSQTFELTYVPHKAGDVELTAEITYAEEALKSNTVTVAIAEETAADEQQTAVVSGIILYANAPVAGIEVKLIETLTKGRSVDASASAVTYSATTDEDGKFSIPVIKSDRNYQLVAAVSDEYTYTHATTIAPAGQDVELNEIETKLTPAGIENINVEDSAAVYYNLQGIRVDNANLAPGIYIRSTSKGTSKILKK